MSDINDLMKDLQSEDFILRKNAATRLGELKARDALPKLKDLLSDRKLDVRAAAAQAIVNMEKSK